MKNFKKFSSGFLMLICFITFAQEEKTITGVVSDDQGPLPGAIVAIKGKNKGVQTNIDGKYSITAKEKDILVFSFIGMETIEKKVGKNNVINVVLKSGSVNLDEVVVTQGYRTKTKKTAVVASAIATSNTIENRPNASYTNTLQGQLAGVNITANSGQPGAKSTVIIGGNNSINPKTNPLYIIDGIETNADALKKIDPNLIDKVDVLKESVATSSYGSKAKNGVIIIATKKGLTKEEIKTLEIEGKKINQEATYPTVNNQEDYDSFVENAFESPKTAPLSTFSIDVDNASYTNIRRFINNGQKVPKDAVRIEEMMNFFKYQYPQPVNEHPFSINTEYSSCPWNATSKLLRIGLQGKTIPTEDLPASNLVFLIDVSGSMSDYNKLPLVKESLKILVQQLRKQDKISIVVYAGAAGLVLSPTSGDEKEKIINSLNQLQSGGSTAGGAGIMLAYKTAEEQFIKNGNNRIILATDGDFNVGQSSDSDMQTLIEEKRKSGVFLTCLGFGMGNYKDSKMEILANKGNGNYAYIDTIQEANRFLGKEFKGSMFAIAKDVKIQIEFNPAHVKAYRLIGYENRKLRPEDFKNDAIDAGELGSGHTVTALYEILPNNTESKYFTETDDLKYTKSQPTDMVFTPELATVKFRYKKPDGETSIEMVKTINNQVHTIEVATADFKFCTAVAWFGLKLRDSKLVDNKSLDAIKELAKQGIVNDTDGYKAELIRLIESSAAL